MEPEVTVVGGIMRFDTMVQVIRQHLTPTVPDGDLVQFIPALGAALLGQQRMQGGRSRDGHAHALDSREGPDTPIARQQSHDGPTIPTQDR